MRCIFLSTERGLFRCLLCDGSSKEPWKGNDCSSKITRPDGSSLENVFLGFNISGLEFYMLNPEWTWFHPKTTPTTCLLDGTNYSHQPVEPKENDLSFEQQQHLLGGTVRLCG